MLPLIAFLTAVSGTPPTPPSPPTWEAVYELPPDKAGEVVLAGEDHRPIVAVRWPCCIYAPWRTFYLIEAPVPIERGCTRVLWQARFSQRGDNARAALQKVLKHTGIARLTPTGCPAEAYTYSSLPVERVLHWLEIWDALRIDARTKFDCTDETSNDLCPNPTLMRVDLGEKWVGTVYEELDVVRLILVMPQIDGPKQIYTEVTFDPAGKGPVRLVRRFPPIH